MLQTAGVRPAGTNAISSVGDLSVRYADGDNESINRWIADYVAKMTERGQSLHYYQSKRNAFDRGKIEEDMFLGKKAEFFAIKLLHERFGFPAVKPDLRVYQSRKKGWGPDLLCRTKDANFPNVHVKSCSRSTCDYCSDWSWTFQYCNSDGVAGRDDLFGSPHPDDLVALAYLDSPLGSSAVVKAILPWATVRNHLADPKSPRLRGLKKCVYYKTLVGTRE